LGSDWTKPWVTVTDYSLSFRIEILSGLSSPSVMFYDVSRTYKRLDDLTNDIQLVIAKKLGVRPGQGPDILRPASTKLIVMGTSLILENVKLENGGYLVDKVRDLLAEQGLDVR